MEAVGIREIAAVTGGRISGDGGGFVTGAVIDSREVSPGDLFAALPGERADGHAFIGGAFDGGAACCLAARVPEGERRPVVAVPDVERALKTLAAWYRSKFDIPVVGIVGSVGKTTSKEMVASVLSERLATLKTEKNYNNELGVPLTLFHLERKHRAAVIEMGISDFGEMARLAEMVRPTMAVFTVIGHAHLERLRDREGVYKAKTEILDYMPPDGTVFVNGDDDLLGKMVCAQKKVSFGLDPALDVFADNIRNVGLDACACDIVSGERRFPVLIPAFGAHMVYAALEGAAVGLCLGLSDVEIAAGIARYRGAGRRCCLEDTGYIRIMDDCYNSNPTSAASALVSLRALPGRRVCILGDMLELGEDSEKLHCGLGRKAARSGAALVIACGMRARAVAEGAKACENGPEVLYFPQKRVLIDALPDIVRRGDSVLVKASRGMRFEDIVEALKRLKG